MRRDPSDIDRLIEEGLDRYGAGDIDGALLAWERALELDPDNSQATSYVEYVRVNYDLLVTAEPELADSQPPFAIHEEPEYEIEIIAGELPPAHAAPLYIDPLDTGWAIEDEQTMERGPPKNGSNHNIELVAEEPPGISFDDATKEYTEAQRQARAGDFRTEEPAAGDFNKEETTGGFSQSTTDIKARSLGFVQPTEAPPQPPELKVTLRTPAPVKAEKSDRVSASRTPTVDLAQPPDDDLIASLPSPRPVGTTPPLERADTADSPEVSVGMSTKEFAGVPTAKLPGVQQLTAQQDEPIVSAPTRDLGMRPRPPTIDDEPTTQSAASSLRAAAAGTQKDIATPFDAIDTKAAQILDDVDQGAPDDETREDRTRRRITDLVERALAWSGITELDKAVIAIELAFNEDPNSALAQKLIHRNRDTIMNIFQAYLGDLERQPQLARPLHELAATPISPRAAFLMSRIDGTLTLDEILDVSGMPRFEAYRHLAQLFLRGILR